MNQKSTRDRYKAAAEAEESNLFDAIIQRARQSGDLDQAEPILNFCRSCTPDTETGMEILRAPYNFDFVPSLIYGTNEGIYLDCHLEGKITEHGLYSLRIGTMKTLGTGIEDCKIMGELCGALMYHARKYMDELIHECASVPRLTKVVKRPSGRRRSSAVSQ